MKSHPEVVSNDSDTSQLEQALKRRREKLGFTELGDQPEEKE